MKATFKYDGMRNRLIAECFDLPERVDVIFRLKRHSTTVDESERVSNREWAWEADHLTAKSADYHVEVEIPDLQKTIVTEWQFVAGSELRKKFDTWLDEDPDAEIAPRDVPSPDPLPKPYENIAVVVTRDSFRAPADSAEEFATLSKHLGASWYSRDEQTDGEGGATSLGVIGRPLLRAGAVYALSSAPPVSDDRGTWFLGSGFAFDNGVLRRSSEVHRVVDADVRHLDLGTGIGSYDSAASGDFCLVRGMPDGSVEFHTDYVGTGAWYQYSGAHVEIVATSYLLAVWVAGLLSEELSLDANVIDANFTSLTQAFQQPLLDELDIQGFRCVPPSVKLIVSPDGVIQEESSQLGMDLLCPPRFTVDGYNSLVAESAEAISSNCHAIFADPEIESIRCDISGGLDSRMLLAGLLNASGREEEKLTLHTDPADRAPSESDESIALLVNAATGIPFDSRPEISLGPLNAVQLADFQVAATFGYYWHRSHSHRSYWDPSVVHVGGAGLDDIARDYTSGSWKIQVFPISDPEEVGFNLARQVFKWRGRASMKGAPSAGVSSVAKSWNDLPGDERDKASQIFNFHRARFHGSGLMHANYGTWHMNPGLVRPLYLLRMMAGRAFSLPHAQMKILEALSPMLSDVPYGNNEYNSAFSETGGVVRTDFEVDPTGLEGARRRRSEGRSWVSSDASAAPGAKDEGPGAIELAKGALRELAREPELRVLMIPAYRFAEELLGDGFGMSDSYGKTFVNKVLHLQAALHLTRYWRRAPSARA